MRRLTTILIPIIFLFSCNTSSKEKSLGVGNTEAQPTPKGPENTNTRAFVNGVDIEYDECGRGDITLLFVHGWCINKEYWNDQKKYFCDRYKVVTLDLPGFGKSGKNRDSWTFEQYTDDINEFIKEKQLKNVILIGHSMSGDLLLLTDLKYPQSVIGIVGIDNLRKPGKKNSIGQEEEAQEAFAMLDSNFSGTVEKYASELFPSSADKAIIDRVINDFKNSDHAIAIKVLRSMAEVSQMERDMMEHLTHKLYLVNSDAGATTEIDSLQKYCKASAEVVYVNGTGHYPMIEKPDEFNIALEKVIRMIANK